MSENAKVYARIDVGTKAETADPLVRNVETIAAMCEARRGGLPRFDSIDALIVDLNAGN